MLTKPPVPYDLCIAELFEALMVMVMVMVTVFRIRQLRIRNDSCEIHPQFSSTINVCYGKYSAQDEDTRRFGPGFRK